MAVALTVLSALPVHAQLVITEVAWAGSDASDSDEWIELYNAGATPICDLSAYKIIGAGTTGAAITLSSSALGAGAFFVVENTAGVPLATGPGVQVSAAISLTNAGEALCVCPVAATTCADITCDVANEAGAWPSGGSNTPPKKTIVRGDPQSDGKLDASWAAGDPPSPGTAPFAAEPGSTSSCPTGEGEGEGSPGEGEGEPPLVPNDPPTLSVSAPSEPVNVGPGGSLDVTYSVTDPDAGDVASVDLYAAPSAGAFVGTQIARGLPAGIGVSVAVDVGGLVPGTYKLFAVARDLRGGRAQAFAPGGFTTSGGAAGDVTFKLTEPDGVNDVDDQGATLIAWKVTIPPGVLAPVTLVLDTDEDGKDGIELAGALSAAEGGPRTFAFKPDDVDVPPGIYHVVGVLDVDVGGETQHFVSVAPADITIAEPGCACSTAGSSRTPRLPGLLALGMLCALGLGRSPFRFFVSSTRRAAVRAP